MLAPQTFSYRYEVNTLAYFNCHQGYYREGSGSAICQSSGNWSEETPKCVAASKENEPLYSMSVTFEDTCPFIGPLFQTSGESYSKPEWAALFTLSAGIHDIHSLSFWCHLF